MSLSAIPLQYESVVLKIAEKENHVLSPYYGVSVNWLKQPESEPDDGIVLISSREFYSDDVSELSVKNLKKVYVDIFKRKILKFTEN